MYSYPVWYFTFVNIITASTINITDIRLFNLIKTKFGEKEAEEFVALVKDEIDEKVDVKHEFITKTLPASERIYSPILHLKNLLKQKYQKLNFK